MPDHRVSTVALFIAIAGIVGACGGSQEPEVTRSDQGVLRLGSVQAVDTLTRVVGASDRPLVLEGLRGSVRLRGADQPNADLSFVRRGRGESPEAARSVLDGISVTSQGTSAEYVYTWTAEDEDYASVDVRGTVPREGEIRIDRVGGPVQLAGLRGALTVQHEHGSVDVRRAGGPVRVDIQNGSVGVDFRALPSEGPLHLETRNGDVRVALPPDASARVDARTDVGSIRTRGLSLQTERLVPVNAGAQYDAQLGTGGPTLELRTQNGTITLLRADTTRTDATTSPLPADTLVPTPDTTLPGGTPDTILSDTSSADTTSR